MIIRKKLAVKMSLYILAGVFSVFILIIIYNYQVSRKIILKETESNASNLSQSILHQVENKFLPAQKIPENLAHILENLSFTKEGMENFLGIIVRNNQDIFGSCIAFEPYAFDAETKNYAPYCYYSNDSVILTDLANNHYNYRDWPWYIDPKRDGPGWGEPYFDEGGGNIVMATYSVPFYDNHHSGTCLGVVTVDISLEKLRKMIGNIKIYNNGYAFLLSREGMFMCHPDSLVVAKESVFSFSRKNNLPDLEQIGRDMVAGKTGFMQYYSLLLKEDCYLFHTSLGSNGWSLAMVIPEKEILADLYNLNRRILIIGSIGLIAIFIIIILISGGITTPIERLAEATHRIGSGEFEVSLPVIRSKDEIGELTGSFALMQDRLRKYIHDLRTETAAREKIESELKIAHDIQQGIIPKTFPPFPDRSDIDIHAALIPAREVGGDLYDYFFVEDDILAFVIGDVSGKGVPASLLMAITRTLFRSRAQKGMKVNEIMEAINSDLCIENENAMFVTLFMGLLNFKNGELEYCNAGHNYPFILHKSRSAECLEITHGTPAGLFNGLKYGRNNIIIHKNDCIVLYTDGVTEAMNLENELFGEERLKQALENNEHGNKVSRVTELILDEVTLFASGAEQSDDITLLVLSFK
jgi:sigma-B regulation protein RsbU (phosphoserine phosphatase)